MAGGFTRPRSRLTQGPAEATPAIGVRLPALALTAGALALGLWLRARNLAALFLYGDELHSLALSRSGYAEIFATYEPFGSGIALPLAQRISFDLFGPSLWAFRLPTLLAGLAALPLLFVVARRFVGTPAAALATIALALNPLHVYHSHFARAYAATALLGLVLPLAIARVLESERPPRRWIAVAIASAGLLPFVHLTAASFVVSVGVAAFVLLVRRRRPPGVFLAIGLCFGAGTLLTLGLHVAAWESVRELLMNKTANRPESLTFTAFDVAVRYAGSAGAAAFWGLAVLAAALWMLRARPDLGILVATSALLPLAILAIVRPVGGVYAYARYLLVVLPWLCVLPAWGLVEVARRALRDPRAADAVALLAGSALIALAFATSPLGRGEAAGPFANLPTSLHVSDPDAQASPSDFYRELATDDTVRRIAETPLFSNWRLGLYRHAFVEHRKQVWLGAVGPPPFDELEGPYLDVRNPDDLRAAGIDVLIVHRDVERERGGTEAAPRALGPEVLRALRERHGPPDYADAYLLAWRITGPR